jgi:hypothetical protein
VLGCLQRLLHPGCENVVVHGPMPQILEQERGSVKKRVWEAGIRELLENDPTQMPRRVIRVRNWGPLQTALELKQMCISWVNGERISNFHFDAQRKLTILGEKIRFDKAAFMFNIARYN